MCVYDQLQYGACDSEVSIGMMVHGVSETCVSMGDILPIGGDRYFTGEFEASGLWHVAQNSAADSKGEPVMCA